MVLQTIALNLFWVFSALYSINAIRYLYDENFSFSLENEMTLLNFYSSTADFFFVIHDWLFIQEYLQASLFLPIAISYFDIGSEVEKKKG